MLLTKQTKLYYISVNSLSLSLSLSLYIYLDGYVTRSGSGLSMVGGGAITTGNNNAWQGAGGGGGYKGGGAGSFGSGGGGSSFSMGNISTLLNYCGYADVGNGRVIITITNERTQGVPSNPYIPPSGKNSCLEGSYGDLCMPCPAGTYAPNQSASCLPCAAGNF